VRRGFVLLGKLVITGAPVGKRPHFRGGAASPRLQSHRPTLLEAGHDLQPGPISMQVGLIASNNVSNRHGHPAFSEFRKLGSALRDSVAPWGSTKT
jgi:hypothetical protein